jgi:hypothetical protein
MLFLPVTRPPDQRVVASLAASDIPRHAIVYVDSPHAEAWPKVLRSAGFDVSAHTSGNCRAPVSVDARRARHLAMRRASQRLTHSCGRVLYLEDDGIVPPDVWSRLSALLDSGYVAATGIETSRRGSLRAPGLWLHRGDTWATVWPHSASPVDACGHFCLLTDGETYGRVFTPEYGEAIDRAHTRLLTPLACDPDCVVGHLLDTGQVVTAPQHLVAYRGGKEVARVKAYRTPAGTFWPDLHTNDHDPTLPYDDDGIQRVYPRKEAPMRDSRTYITKGTIIRGRGHVEYKRRREISLTEARRLADAGCTYLDGPLAGQRLSADPDIYPHAPVPYEPREEIKPIDPRTALKNVCPECGKKCKSAAGLASHIAAGKC